MDWKTYRYIEELVGSGKDYDYERKGQVLLVSHL